ncbi:MFS transporter [Luteipulveratus mongoliensis]|uniref:MFS transporter n=1 Tax=Luteipulveratus mongoliensis TaxID=571913 RepID=UPI0006971E66|nr:MFS transporter [Luteipulveratus mongoliensis]
MTSLRQRAFVPALIFIGAVVSIVSSLGAPLIPRLADELHTTVGNAQWALTATVVVAGVASPLVGRLGDGRHRKTVIVVCQSSVVIGGVLAALATSLPLLISGRALQGLGLALMPLTMAAAREHLRPDHAGRVIATLSVVGAAGVGLGYPITGLIADHGGVHAAYWAGTGVSALALAAAIWAIPSPESRDSHQRIDYTGAAIIGAGLVALLVSLDKAAAWGWGSARTLVLLVSGIALLTLWVAHELRTSEPLVDLRLVRHRAVLTANVSGLLLGVTMYLSMVTITQLVQLSTFGFGESVFVAGLTLVPLSVLSASVSRTLPALTRRFGLRPIIPAGALCVVVASVFFGSTASHLWQAFVTMAILGVGLGYTFAAMPGLIVSAVPPEETGSAMGFYQVSRFVGFAIGSGLAVTLLQAFGSDGTPTLHAYRMTAFVGAGVGVLTAVCAWLLPGSPTDALETDRELTAYEREEALLAAAGLEDRDDPGRARAASHP